MVGLQTWRATLVVVVAASAVLAFQTDDEFSVQTDDECSVQPLSDSAGMSFYFLHPPLTI